MTDNDSGGKNIIDLANIRKEQRTLGKRQGFGGKRQGGHTKDRGLNGGSSGHGKNGKGRKLGFWAYLQFALFLGVMAYMMQLCSRS